jgi:queuine tRNA-ribosyltransferase
MVMPVPTGDADSDLGSLGDYVVYMAREGFASIQQISSGEIFHLRSAPMEEARSLYLEQSGLAGMLTETAEPLVIWDVGLGAAANAMAAIHCYEEHPGEGILRPMTVISFENDLHPLELALRYPARFPYLYHPAPLSVLRNARWQSEQQPGLSWQLVQGDFRTTVLQTLPPPDLIFYDMFSSKSCPELWTLEIFQKVFRGCKDRTANLITYSRSTSSRAALLGAGFYVARGRASGAQEESTIALTPTAAAQAHNLLGCNWLDRWERSKAKYPVLLPAHERPAFDRLIRSHPQFCACPIT